MSGGSHSLQMDRDVFVCDGGSFVALAEDCHGRILVCIEALCACFHAESGSHWEDHGVDIPCLGDCFSVVKVLLDAPDSLYFCNYSRIEDVVPSLV